MEAADDDRNDGRRDRERPQPLRQFFRLSCAGTAGPGDFAIVVRGRSGLRRAARCCDEIRLAAARVGNDRRLRSDHGFRRGDAVGCGRRLARASWKRAGFQRIIRRQAGVDRCPRRAGRRLREFIWLSFSVTSEAADVSGRGAASTGAGAASKTGATGCSASFRGIQCRR